MPNSSSFETLSVERIKMTGVREIIFKAICETVTKFGRLIFFPLGNYFLYFRQVGQKRFIFHVLKQK